VKHYHDSWHKGYWDWRSFAWGAATGFFTNRVLSYASGYHVYSNPYYVPTVVVEGQPVVVDYSQPVVVQVGAEAEENVSPTGLDAFNQARESFYAGD
jgi:hypothetical protein